MPVFTTSPRFAAGSFSPSDISGMYAWFDGATPAQGDGTSVSTWADTSGNSRDATQATGGLQPIYKTSIIGTESVVRFDGTDDYLRTATFTSPGSTVTVFCVSKFNATGQRFLYDGHNTSGGRQCVFQESGNTWNMFAGTLLSGGTTDQTTFHISVAVFNGASSKLYVDGGAALLSGNAGSGSVDGITLGTQQNVANGFGAADAAFWNGYNSALSLTDINRMGNYLSSRYGLTWTTAT